MFTGLYSTQIKLIGKFLHKLSSKLPVLTEIIKDLGYFTICYSENPWISKFFRLTRGFDSYFKNFRRSFELLENNKIIRLSNFILKKIDSLMKRLNNKRISSLWQNNKIIISNLVEKIIKIISWKNWLFESKNTLNILDKYALFLKKNINKKPFYLFFNIMASHYPYISPKEALSYCEFKIGDFKILKNFLIDIRSKFVSINIKSNPMAKKQVKILEKLYNSSVYYNDMILGKIFSILSSLELLKNSYVIITSDHGEHLSDQSDHYYYGHGVDQSAYEPLIKVPLIIYNSNFNKRIVKNQVELKDLFHTILHLTGFPNNRNKYLNIKKSILYQINNNSTPKYIYGEHLKVRREMTMIVNKHRKYIKKNQIPRIINDLYFLRTSRYKYINFENQIEEFYDSINDPHEQSNIANKNSENYREMKTYLQDFIKKIKNINEMEALLTEREKDVLNKTINRFNIKF